MPRILIAEDDSLISSFIEKGLRARGYSTHVVDDGEHLVTVESALGVSSRKEQLVGMLERSGIAVNLPAPDAPRDRGRAAGTPGSTRARGPPLTS